MTTPSKGHAVDLAWWVGEMQKAIHKKVGKSTWRNFMKRVLARVDGENALLIMEEHDTNRFLYRLGFIPAGAVGQAAAPSVLRKAADSSGVPVEELVLIVRAFASGYYGLLDEGFCADVPACAACCFRMFCSYAARSEDLHRLPESESFRCRLALGGMGALGVSELLTLVISAGRSEMKAFRTVQKLLAEAGSLRALGAWSVKELENFDGVSREAAIRIRSALDLAVYWAAEPRPPGTKFSSARDFMKYYGPRLRDRKAEYFLVVLLDQKNRLIGEVSTGGGGLSGANIDPRTVLTQAIRDSAARVAFVHNHPSGDPTPSPEDLDVTARLVQVCGLAGIRVLDHVVIAGDRYVSMAEDGYI
ncbi:MAG: hypothetical protein JW909_02360 [Planctomycetes bacterium]|nr:hypothetical protein [Planctomycetota bacterium]